MSIHCEGSDKAEVIFSLPYGGKEGRVTTNNCPIEVTFGGGRVIYVFKYNQPIEDAADQLGTLEGTESLTQLFKTYAPENENWLVSPYKDASGIRGISVGINALQDGSGEFIYPELLKFWAENIYESPYRTYAYYIGIELSNNFTISDTTGIIYRAEYPDGVVPNYEASCFACSLKETAIQGEFDLVCIDVDKVVNGLNRVRSKLKNYGSR